MIAFLLYFTCIPAFLRGSCRRKAALQLGSAHSDTLLLLKGSEPWQERFERAEGGKVVNEKPKKIHLLLCMRQKPPVTYGAFHKGTICEKYSRMSDEFH